MAGVGETIACFSTWEGLWDTSTSLFLLIFCGFGALKPPWVGSCRSADRRLLNQWLRAKTKDQWLWWGQGNYFFSLQDRWQWCHLPALLKGDFFGNSLEAKHADLPEGACGSLHILLCSGEKYMNSDGEGQHRSTAFMLWEGSQKNLGG